MSTTDTPVHTIKVSMLRPGMVVRLGLIPGVKHFHGPVLNHTVIHVHPLSRLAPEIPTEPDLIDVVLIPEGRRPVIRTLESHRTIDVVGHTPGEEPLYSEGFSYDQVQEVKAMLRGEHPDVAGRPGAAYVSGIKLIRAIHGQIHSRDPEAWRGSARFEGGLKWAKDIADGLKAEGNVSA